MQGKIGNLKYRGLTKDVGGNKMKFDLLHQIGEKGGFGKVYKCTDENGKVFACKILENQTEMSFKRFEREIRLLSRLNHPNIIKVVNYNIENTPQFYIMPLYSCSLKSIIPVIHKNIYLQYSVLNSILSGVAYLHSEGVIHRDLKPENILFNSENDIVITDLGLGIQPGSDSTTLTQNGNWGTYRYCSPEQWSNMHSVDYRTDIYAIGMIIEDIVTNMGEVPVGDSTLKYIIDKCIKKNKEERFGRIEDLKRILDGYFSYQFGWQEKTALEELLMKVEKNQASNDEIIDIANRIIKEKDKERIEKFFILISPVQYKFLEVESLSLMKDLIFQVCEYWNQYGWPYSYIDTIADVAEKIYHLSNDTEIKSLLLFHIMDLSINYNRWYAMGIVKRIFIELESNISVQSELAIRLRNKRLNILNIFGTKENLPPMVRELY